MLRPIDLWAIRDVNYLRADVDWTVGVAVVAGLTSLQRTDNLVHRS